MLNDPCKICGKLIDLKGFRSTCSRRHFYCCPVCGELFEIKTCHDLRIYCRYGSEFDNIRILVLDDEICVFDYIIFDDLTIYDYCCSQCIKIDYIKNIKKELKRIRTRHTSQERYGEDCPLQSKEVREKSIKTCQEKYGCNHHMQSKEVQDKVN